MKGELGDDSRRPKCLLDVLLKLHIEDQVLDEDGVGQEVDTFISAGHDSISVTVKWALYLIGLYPDVQEKIHHELDSVLGADSKGPLSVADLNELKYMDCVLKESNRLYPPAAAFGRKVPEEISIRVFAEMQGKILVYHILKNFCLRSLDSRDQVLPIIKLSLQSSQPARIKFRRRQQ
ncbi:probable cytochrome P450 4d20 [Caerostris darwini]|uniref:Probable cytochrome P450 4d20 n=1 Tax=Caerostris darwini TaxID=1538125 RepID=A0AAV4PA90_9ARAC|nr:probable cytochrome P450 4d20 [Caerostris darwini]